MVPGAGFTGRVIVCLFLGRSQKGEDGVCLVDFAQKGFCPFQCFGQGEAIGQTGNHGCQTAGGVVAYGVGVGEGCRFDAFVKSSFAVSCKNKSDGNGPCQGGAPSTVVDFDFRGAFHIFGKGT